jgi:1-aminocyclopropane-1-carboxylate synthase
MAASSTSTLSSRGQRAVKPALSYFGQFLEAQGDLHDEASNPDGFVVCAVAENRQVCHKLAERLSRTAPVPVRSLAYDDMRGSQRLREAFGKMIQDTVLSRGSHAVTIDPEKMIMAAGTGALLDMACWCLTEAKSSVIIPSPYYPAFDNDFGVRCECTVVPAPTEDTSFCLTEAVLDAAAADADARGRPAQLLVITNPNNPLGIVHGEDEVYMAVKWAVGRKMHVIVDEIYANSLFDDGPMRFRSVLSTLAERDGEELLSPYIHVAWGMAKDFGASGLRVSGLYSANDELHSAFSNLGYFATMGGPLQAQLAEVLEDTVWVREYLAESCTALETGYKAVSETLTSAGIPVVKASGSLFAFIDLRGLLDAPTFEAEARLQETLFRECKLLLVPGAACHTAQPGFFRVCCSWMPPASVEAGMRRLVGLYESKQSSG